MTLEEVRKLKAQANHKFRSLAIKHNAVAGMIVADDPVSPFKLDANVRFEYPPTFASMELLRSEMDRVEGMIEDYERAIEAVRAMALLRNRRLGGQK
jgi:hypothetical protein